MGNVIEDDELDITTDADGTEAESIGDTDEDGFELELDDESGEGDAEGDAESSDDSTEGSTESVELSAEEAKAKAEADAKAKVKAEREAANEVALNNFKAVVDEILASDSLDVTTGEPTTEHNSMIGTAYSAFASKAGQNQALAFLNERMQAKLLEAGTKPGSFVQARTYLELSNHLKSIGQVKETITKEPVDPTKVHVDRVAALLLAPNFVAVPEGVSEDWQEKARELANSLYGEAGEYIAWQRAQAALTEEERAAQGENTNEPKVSDVVKRAAQVAAGRAIGGGTTRKRAPKGEGTASTAPRTPYTGTRRDIGKHIESAFEGVEVGGFLTVGDIVKHVSDEYPEGPENRPSQGAVAARLFPKSGKCTIENVRPEGPAQGRSNKGAVKTA